MNAWEFFHNLIVHPLMAITLNSKWSIKLHDISAEKAWPRASQIFNKGNKNET